MEKQSNYKELSEDEHIKDKSDYLRGRIKDSLKNPLTGALFPDDVKLIKYHGSYQQYDRDLESERKQKKLEPLYQFMVRVRAAGGVTTPRQWLVLDELSELYGNDTLKLTTRQSFQFHGILKRNLKPTIQKVNEVLLSTLATCGDVNRNVMCNPNPYQSHIHEEVYQFAKEISDYFLPKTTAYHEIWLDKEKVAGTQDFEPLYQHNYLPRKFKIAIAIPPKNDIDIFANDLGLIAIEENNNVIGYNICVGGGLGSTFGVQETYPRLADVIGFSPKEKVFEVAETVIAIQRDYGNRSDRKLSRLKHTIDDRGLEWFVGELQNRLGWNLAKPKSYRFRSNGDEYGWQKGINNKWFYTLFVEHGRVRDENGYELKKALREIAKIHSGDFRLTGNQNLIIGNIEEDKKQVIEAILEEYAVGNHPKLTGLRKSSMACVALNTCGLAFAEAERYLPSLIDKLEVIMRNNGLDNDEINIRMTGCPNNCARSSLGEIGFVGRAIGRYNMYLGASHNGDRLNTLYKEMLSEENILMELEPIIRAYAKERLGGEYFGDFVIRKKIVEPTQRPIRILN
ncbi:assimilatory sulfite reductase (NADPH) hemoprotein subunit [Arenibacter algicola]|jgi:sulfite reductase (NADPH) hemoprotein beta-component|uniref:Sulfite reductase [NADPH] hemoprotein beta-component n=1 Tax=Arenibacter algicola TaxID=616991 RepID=A0A221V1L4_9FLAO|nr:assimilatory sulfite reductase (NADPH) hemoprotein subunit [Arenibacter algicola]ASO07484.1 sulfite reductase [NADPH] hemoprotein beta-component [Arenibacter algicola]|tara:strand:- start:74295 stop:75995 length:1701 start_codon:yes stop_codon:yes gene_type:complete